MWLHWPIMPCPGAVAPIASPSTLLARCALSLQELRIFHKKRRRNIVVRPCIRFVGGPKGSAGGSGKLCQMQSSSY